MLVYVVLNLPPKTLSNGWGDQVSEKTHDFLKALASPARQRIRLLFSQGAELSVSEVAEQAGIGQSTVSEQLTLLRRGGIVTSRREGKIVLYRRP
ncbi:hypothetical protein GCM10027280_26340 [Micromonospora polyrhachis]|nr:metalloregulator ArsR/SmtB family transcription factor [Micromonospora polyrhachis]